MNRVQILREIKKYFNIEELVCPHIYSQWKDKSWQFLDTDFLHALLVIRRDILCSPMTCNSGSMSQRGMRCNMCNMVRTKNALYIPAHILGKAGDFTVEGMTAQEARNKVKSHSYLLPCAIRLEKDVDWLHFDVRSQDETISKIYEFNA